MASKAIGLMCRPRATLVTCGVIFRCVDSLDAQVLNLTG